MMIHLLNSAVITQEGVYESAQITKSKFVEFLKTNEFKHYIGYSKNLELIKQWTGIDLKPNRDTVKLQDGDILLVMKLKFRVTDTQLKSDKKFQSEVSEDEFEFFLINYKVR